MVVLSSCREADGLFKSTSETPYCLFLKQNTDLQPFKILKLTKCCAGGDAGKSVWSYLPSGKNKLGYLCATMNITERSNI